MQEGRIKVLSLERGRAKKKSAANHAWREHPESVKSKVCKRRKYSEEEVTTLGTLAQLGVRKMEISMLNKKDLCIAQELYSIL